MGYYSYYTLTAEDADGRPMIGTDPAIAETVMRISEYDSEWWTISDGEMRSTEMKWYDQAEHLGEISAAFPALRFTLFAEGEDGAQTYFYATGGKVEECNGEMVFPARSIW